MTFLTSFAAFGVFIAVAPTRPSHPPTPSAGPPGEREPARYVPTAEELAAAYQRGQQPQQSRGKVYKDQVTPHWFADNTRFWYRNDLRGGAKEFILVDAEKGTREPAFDHRKLAAALSKASGKEYQAERLPFDEITFADGDKAVSFRVAGTAWKCDLAGYECTKDESRSTHSRLDAAARDEALAFAHKRAEEKQQAEELARLESLWPEGLSSDPEQGDAEGQAALQRPPQDRGGRSPDGKWTASVKDHNVFLRSQDDKEVPLSKDGTADNAYGMLEWAPDSKALVAFRTQPGENKEVYLIQSSPQGGGRAKLRTRPYPLPGDKFTTYELNLFDVDNAKQTKPDVGLIDLGRPNLRWAKDGHTFRCEKRDRGHQRFRLIEVDALAGKSRNIIDEQAKTFICSPGYSIGRMSLRHLERTDEYVYPTEKDGWKHLYLIDAKTGKETLMTPGEFVVRGISQVDEEKRQLWFTGCGRNPGQDPYLVHHYRVNFDGTGLVALTEGDGEHAITFSPDRKYLLDKYQRIDLAPVHELRRVADGKLVCKLEEADVGELKANGWEPPEVFVAKGRDGKTDIWGYVCRPPKLDPTKKYPVIEQIYAGPQGFFSKRDRFSAAGRFTNLTGLGFIVVQLDGMGTQGRSKAFHDVCWKDLKDAGLPDRILWHQAVAKKYPYYDISHVGITGGSAGGQNSTGAVLFHPDFYKVAVSGCGCHDNRMDKASWNEQWMGYPVGPHYAACSNVDNAHRLRGKLLLIVGELDENVPPESTLRVADALIKAGKDFDLLVVPNAGHGMGGAYGSRRQQDYFVRHLLGVEPPDRNAGR